MLDRVAPPIMQRARGRASVRFERWADTVRLTHLHQSGCLKAMLPRNHLPTPEVVFINTAGGITGGDRLAIDVGLGPDAQLTLTTQTAERLYRAIEATGELDIHLDIGASGFAHWLPQETIIYNQARLARRLNVDLAGDAGVLLLESYMLGRKAMGETVEECWISDRWHVRRAGRLVFAEAVRIDNAKALKSAAALGPNRAFATLALIEPGAEDRLPHMRGLLEQSNIAAAASAWPGALMARFIAPDAFSLRKALIPVIEEFQDMSMPRVWQL